MKKLPIIILLSGAKDSGKSTIANYLVDNKNFVELTFASTLRDLVSSLFGWDRQKLEGLTESHRNWQEKTDNEWTTTLGFNVTPKKMLEKISTDLFRDNLHKDFWIILMNKKIKGILENGMNIVITDTNFINEIQHIKNDFPNRSYSVLIKKEIREKNDKKEKAILELMKHFPLKKQFEDFMKTMVNIGHHISEYEWYWILHHQPSTYDRIINNDSDVVLLQQNVLNFIQTVS